MRHNVAALWMTLALLLGDPSQGLAQWTSTQVDVGGTFGQRSLGRTLKPRPGRFADGILRGPSGNFQGRGRPDGGMMFGWTGQQYSRFRHRDAAVGRQPFGAPPNVGPSEPSAAPRRRLPGPAPVAETAPPPEVVPPPGLTQPAEMLPPPERVAPPQIWFRSGATGANSGTTGGSTAVAPSAAAGGVQGPLPPRLRIGFAAVRPADGRGTALAARIARCDRIRRLSPIRVIVDSETAVLRGRVVSEHDRLLAEHFARMEPGIWQVRNELLVGPSLMLSAGE